MSKLFPTFEKIFKKRFSLKKILKKLAIIMIILAAFIIVKDEIAYQFGYEDDYYSDDYYENGSSENNHCAEGDNVSGLILHGDLYTYNNTYNNAQVEEESEDAYPYTTSENIVYYINKAENDPNMKAIFLEIDSWGGSPTAAKEIADALKHTKKPTIAMIREYGLSAAYWVATGADIIFANTTSNVGSIGITMSYLDYSRQNEKDGLIYQQISTGKFKDTGDPDKKLSQEEKQLLQRDTDLLNEIFISEIALSRGMEISDVEKLADGSSMLGQMALDNGLIDRIGGEYEVIEYLEEILGEDVSICW